MITSTFFVGIVGGYFLFNFIPYYFTAEEPPKPAAADTAATTMSGEPPKEITVKKILKQVFLEIHLHLTK